jgi:hypothetical protein
MILKKNKVKIAASILLSIIFIYILIEILESIGFFRIIEVIREVNWVLFIISLLLVFVSYLIWARKWNLLINSMQKLPLLRVLQILFASSFVYATTPGNRIGGEPVRSYYLSKFIKKTKTESFATVIFERSSDSLGLQFMVIFSIIFLMFSSSLTPGFRKLLLALFIVTTFLIVFRLKLIKRIGGLTDFAIIRYITKYIYNFGFWLKKRFEHHSSFHLFVKDRIDRYLDVFFKFNDDKKVFETQMLLGIIRWIFLYFSVYLLFIATGTYVHFLSILIIQTIAMFLGDLSLIPGGIGIQESLMIGLYFTLGIPANISATVALMSRGITYFYSLFLGLICIFILNKKIETI